MRNGKIYFRFKSENERLGDYDTIATNSTLVIQWIFPNFFRSRVNPHASKLQEHEAETFRTDLEVAN